MLPENTPQSSILGDSRRKLGNRSLDLLFNKALGDPNLIIKEATEEAHNVQENLTFHSQVVDDTTNIISETAYIEEGPNKTLEQIINVFKTRPENIKNNTVNLIIPVTNSDNEPNVTNRGHIKTLHLKISYNDDGSLSSYQADYYDPKIFNIHYFNNQTVKGIVEKEWGAASRWDHKKPDLIDAQQLPLNFTDCGYYAYDRCLKIFNGQTNELKYTQTENERKLLFISSKLLTINRDEYPNFHQAAQALYDKIDKKNDSPKNTAAINVLYEIILLDRIEEIATSTIHQITSNEDDFESVEALPPTAEQTDAQPKEEETNNQIKAIALTQNLLTIANPTLTDIQDFFKLSQEFSNSGLRDVASMMLFMISLIVIIAVVASIVTAISAASSGTLTLPILAATIELSTEAWVAYGVGTTIVTAVSTTSATASVVSEKFYNTANKKVESKMIELTDVATHKPS